MQCSSSTFSALVGTVVALVGVAAVPEARAQATVGPSGDPVAAAIALADAVVAGLPVVDPRAAAALVPAPAQALPTLPIAPTQVAAPEAVPAAAAEPNPAMEPHPSPPPPPPQPDVPDPLEVVADLAPVAAEREEAPAAAAAAGPAVQPQYQAEPPQYQPPAAAPVVAPTPAPAPAAAPAPEREWSWDWTWSCGGAGPASQPPDIPVDGMPRNWNWNWQWNCSPAQLANTKSGDNSSDRYQPLVTRYQPININVSIRIGSAGDDGPLAQTNVVLAVEAGPAAAAVTAAIPAPVSPAAAGPAAESAPAAKSADASTAEKRGRAPKTTLPSTEHEPRRLLAAVPAPAEDTIWAARPVVSQRLQSDHPEAGRSRSQLRRPTRRPLPPRRAPAIPVGSAGVSPFGGSDGGGFGFALLLVPFALALVDSARRAVRDLTPPMGRAHRARRERPG